MLTAPKQIVIDKSAFVALSGRRFGELSDFVRQHVLLLSDTLLYECATATKQSPTALLGKCERLVKDGAHYCSMSVHFVQWEAWHCIPYPEVLTDAGRTNRIRNGPLSINSVLTSDIVGYQHELHVRTADVLLAKFSADVKRELDSRVQDIGVQIRELPSARSERLVEWLRHIDQMDIHAMGVESLPAGWIRVSREFCVSSAWMTWQYWRLIPALAYEHWYIRQTGSPRDGKAERDLQDIEYLLLLSRADAIIAEDKGLIELARAAFPGKHVFSSLRDVPESYRCDWASP